ncbi:MAG: STAS domain-containing protein [Lachnospiraceae bacterium]
MEIRKNIQDNTAVLALEGWMDTQAAPQLAEALTELPGDLTSLTLDLASLEYISSSGLRQLVAAHKKMKGNLTLVNVPDTIMDVFHMAGFDKRLNIA